MIVEDELLDRLLRRSARSGDAFTHSLFRVERGIVPVDARAEQPLRRTQIGDLREKPAANDILLD